ncbi:hydrolase, alpha/beta fold family protein [Paenibacillus terrae HPL-003]|uniref:Hydrolase, alpha/beta fold family protein n=1 Tax=Paenibacillus terrae (strain HPL-003) TaxID=985665 RepID=G7VXZ1_PAETH|nr:alpha/beta hydrolase [Paenibacillus terrae]AET57169.1 hydrolase, alpha/beta fold family protein [Paenibacillus terrae HPL-003]
MTTYHSLEVEGINVFYRKAGNPNKPVILLLHGFPSASHMFRELIPILEKDYYLIAPDYPGFGNSSSPDREDFQYTFDHITGIIETFIDKLGLVKYALYVFDYGAPIGFRIAMHHPERVTAVISQNGNIYREGLGDKWAAREEYWRNPTQEKRESYRTAFAPDTIKHQYVDGTKEGQVSPDGYTLDIAYMSRPGNDEKQLDLIFDYQNNVKMYPKFQQYLHEYQPPLLATWGKNDVSFIPAGAEVFKKDLPDAEIYLLDTGHFALETHAYEIGERVLDFLKNKEI